MVTTPSPFSILLAPRMPPPFQCLLLLLLPGPDPLFPVLGSAVDDGGAENTSAGQKRRLFFSLTLDATEKALLAAAAAAVVAASATGRVSTFALAVAPALLAALKNDMATPGPNPRLDGAALNLLLSSPEVGRMPKRRHDQPRSSR